MTTKCANIVIPQHSCSVATNTWMAPASKRRSMTARSVALKPSCKKPTPYLRSKRPKHDETLQQTRKHTNKHWCFIGSTSTNWPKHCCQKTPKSASRTSPLLQPSVAAWHHPRHARSAWACHRRLRAKADRWLSFSLAFGLVRRRWRVFQVRTAWWIGRRVGSWLTNV